MIKGFLGPVLAFAAVAVPITATSQQLSPGAEQAIDAAMREPVRTGWTAGGAVAVMRKGKLVFARGYGMANLETGTPVTPESVFRIGSLTKQFTATAILLLAEDSKLSVDDPVRKYIPELPAGDQTTIRQLLTHTSGIADYVGRPGFERETLLPHTTDQLLAYVLAKAPLHNFEPGAKWEYSSSNYALAGAIVERVSRLPLGAFLKARIFDPLRMTSTALDSSEDVVPHRAAGYDRLKVETPGYINTHQISMSVPFAAGAMRSTVGDLVRWADALTHGRVLKPASNQQMITPVRLNDGKLSSYGMGIFVSGAPTHPNLSHDGAIDGFTSTLAIYTGPDVEVAALVNTSPSSHLPFRDVTAAVKADVGVAPLPKPSH